LILPKFHNHVFYINFGLTLFLTTTMTWQFVWLFDKSDKCEWHERKGVGLLYRFNTRHHQHQLLQHKEAINCTKRTMP